MKTTQTLLLVVTLSTGLFTATAANAALFGSADGKTVYDTDLNITWLADADYAKTSGYDADGMMTWKQAQGWIASLNDSNYLGYNNWRLPTVIDLDTPGCDWDINGTDCGFNVAGSEMAHLYNSELGNISNISPSGEYMYDYGLTYTAPFSNLQEHVYWSGTEYEVDAGSAWYFSFAIGMQGTHKKYEEFHALAVRDNQVAAVPVPAAAWLLGSGLLGLIGVARRKAAQ